MLVKVDCVSFGLNWKFQLTLPNEILEVTGMCVHTKFIVSSSQ